MEGAESVTSSKPESLETEDSTPVTNMEGTVVDSVDISSAGDNVAEDTETNYEGDEFATSTEFAASNEDDEEIVMGEQEEEEDDYDDDDFEPVDVFSGAGPKNDDFPDDPNQEDSDEEDDEAVLARAHKEDMLQGHASEKPEADYDENSSTTASSSAQLSTVGTTDVAKLKLENEHLTMMLNSFKSQLRESLTNQAMAGGVARPGAAIGRGRHGNTQPTAPAIAWSSPRKPEPSTKSPRPNEGFMLSRASLDHELKVVLKRARQYQKSNVKLQRRLDHFTGSQFVKNLEEKIKELAQNLKAKSEEIKTLQESQRDMEKQALRDSQETDLLPERLASARSEVKVKDKAINEKKMQIASLQKERSKHAASAKKFKEVNAKLRKGLEDAGIDVKALLGAESSKAILPKKPPKADIAEIKALKEELTKARRDNRTLASLVDKNRKIDMVRRKEIKTMQGTVEKMKAERDELQRTLEKRDREVTGYSVAVKNLKKTLKQLTKGEKVLKNARGSMSPSRRAETFTGELQTDVLLVVPAPPVGGKPKGGGRAGILSVSGEPETPSNQEPSNGSSSNVPVSIAKPVEQRTVSPIARENDESFAKESVAADNALKCEDLKSQEAAKNLPKLFLTTGSADESFLSTTLQSHGATSVMSQGSYGEDSFEQDEETTVAS